MGTAAGIATILGALALALAVAAHAGGLPGSGVVTLVDGEGTLWREQQRFGLAEGRRVQPDDVLATGDAARLVRVEFDDGRVLDLGPGTQALLQPAALAGDPERAATAYLLQGWLKLAAPAAAAAGVSGPRLDVQRVAGSTIVAAPRDALPWLHVESGSARVVAHEAGRRTAPTPLAEGQVYALRGPASGDVSERLAPAQRAWLPRSFVDGVPRRAARYTHAVDPGPTTAIDYAAAAPWMHAEAVLRPAFVTRLAPRLKDDTFRHAVRAELRLHPEWQRLLDPPAPRTANRRPAAPGRTPGLPILPPPPDDEPVSASDVRAQLP